MAKFQGQIDFTVQEVAGMTGYDDSHVRRLCIWGEIKAKKFGKMWRIPGDEAYKLVRKVEKNPDRKLPKI